MNFQPDVIERSHHIPVLVDFWAPWCGPCRVLSPVIEQLAEEQAGRWELVKINTEEHPDIAVQYRVMSLPNVKLFYRGEVIDEFVGSLPRNAIEQWLGRALPSTTEQTLDEIIAGVKNWPEHEVIAKLEEFVSVHPESEPAYLELARHVVIADPERALALIRLAGDTAIADARGDDTKALAELMLWNDADGDPVSALLIKAAGSLREGSFADAAQALVDAVFQDKQYANDMPRRTGIALFRMLGDDHAVTKAHRRMFDMALY